MAKKEKLIERFKEGVSVEDIEKFARKYTNEVFLILSLVIATISSILGFFTGPSWSVFFMGLSAIIGIAIPQHVGTFIRKLIKIQTRAERTTTVIIGIGRIVFAIFLPFVIFAELGLLAGYSFHVIGKEFISSEPENKPENPKDEQQI